MRGSISRSLYRKTCCLVFVVASGLGNLVSYLSRTVIKDRLRLSYESLKFANEKHNYCTTALSRIQYTTLQLYTYPSSIIHNAMGWEGLILGAIEHFGKKDIDAEAEEHYKRNRQRELDEKYELEFRAMKAKRKAKEAAEQQAKAERRAREREAGAEARARAERLRQAEERRRAEDEARRAAWERRNRHYGKSSRECEDPLGLLAMSDSQMQGEVVDHETPTELHEERKSSRDQL